MTINEMLFRACVESEEWGETKLEVVVDGCRSVDVMELMGRGKGV